ncbi:hypothetical protein ST37_04990 [Vibrio sp. qd031]|uniref:restriction endonuclease subunit S n=1 Tax=Vibrio sp. qd031 TaxID=1603038 RepID=UPI000A249F4B|nr:restriction endonuclease subunit S [Vibrio sp. qd031]ORT51706.1 hypothetical protein ST37_04990 [Vibrio sp. qd031]
MSKVGLLEGWTSTPLENVVDILDSQRIPVNSSQRQARIEGKSQDELYPYYGATGEVGKIDGYIFDEELVALGEDGVPFLEPSKAKAYFLKGKTWVNNHAHVLKGSEGATYNKYLLHFLNQFDYQGYVNGGTRLKLTQANMRKIPIIFPALAEQKTIADKLDTLLAQVATTKSRLEGSLETLKQFRQSVLADAMSGKLTDNWRSDNPSLNSIQLEEISTYWVKQYKASGKRAPKLKLHETDALEGLPNTWLDTKIGNVFDVHVGATPSRSVSEYWNGNVNWVSSSEVAFCRISSTKESITESGLSNTSTNLHPKGTVMLAMIGQGKTRGQVAILDIEACHNQNTAALRVPKGFVVSEFLYFFLTKQYEETRRIGGGNNQKALNKSFVQSLPFPLPPVEEQQEIVNRVEKLFAGADATEQQVNQALERVNNLTQSIFVKAFRGELTEQWRKDNPELISGENSAEALLEKIKAERVAANPKRKTRKKAG